MEKHRVLDGLRVLLVEDEAIILELTLDSLAELGCDVVRTSGTITGGIAGAEIVGLQMAVLDIKLRDGPSWPIAWRLRDLSVPFIFVSGYDTHILIDEFRDVPLLMKPYRLRSLEAALIGMLEAQPMFRGT